MFRPDLHSHTLLSDGALSPARLVERAAGRNVTHLAITDHDCMDALPEARRSAASLDLTIIPGTEISTRWENGKTVREIHIIGLLQDPEEPALQALLRHHQSLRRERVVELARQLEKQGIGGIEVLVDALTCPSPGRNHIADFLIRGGHASNKQDAFKRYLGRQGRLSTPAPWCDMATAIGRIQAAGGIAVLAHPDRYRLGKRQLRQLIDAFVEGGGSGLEVSYSNLNPDVLKHLARQAEERGLWASVGSDFHTPETTWMDLGKLRQLPGHCEPQAVWHHPAWQRFNAA
ncbi:MAG: PHP domain-containing protein [Pseudohongiellaceae bacterium]